MHFPLTIRESQSAIDFECVPPVGRCFERYLTLGGERAYHIGLDCWSCVFSLSRLAGADKAEPQSQFFPPFGEDLRELTQESVSAIEPALPNGEYIVMLTSESPRLVTSGDERDYFTTEVPRTFPFHTRSRGGPIEYYRTRSFAFDEDRAFFEFVIPLVPGARLHAEAVLKYEALLEHGGDATAVAISILDKRGPSDWPDDFQPEFKEHWCLTHYLIDGHHKMRAAANTRRGLMMVSFLAADRGISKPADIQRIPELLAVR